jgi:polyisoprenoid-binding protein YceI
VRTASGICCGLVFILLATANSWADTVQLGNIKFTANTNVRMFKFTGEVKDLTSSLARTNGTLSSFALTIPVKSIKTGMDIRDKHMQERVFTASDNTLPDITYKATSADCKPGASATEQVCVVAGQMSIRGETKPYPLTLTLNGSKISGSTDIDVFQFGVKPELLQYSEIKVDNKVHLDFEVKIQ